MGGLGSGSKPREYPAEIVEQIIGWYQSGMTISEIKEIAPKGYRVQTILQRYLPERRRRIKRNQVGAANSSWKGSEASYTALHLRVQSARGKPSFCVACEKTEGRFEWATLTGDYQNVFDYIRLCVSCHRKFDKKVTKPGRRAFEGGDA